MEREIASACLNLIQRSDFVIVSTLNDGNGFPDTRAMFNLLKMRAETVKDGPARLDNPFASWLGTNTSSQKVRHMRKDPRVCLYYVDTAAFQGLSIQGRVSEVLDPCIRKAIWTDGWEMYYAGGMDGGDFTVLRFEPEHGRYYHGLKVVDFDATKSLEALRA